MTLAVILPLLRRFWWAVPLAGLLLALAATRHTLASRTVALEAERAAHAQDLANVKATADKARADDIANSQRVQSEDARIAKDIQDDLTARLADARAAAARSVRSASAADPGRVAGADMPSPAPAPGGAAGAGQTAEMDAIACAEGVTKAQGWQDWWRSVSAVERNPQ